ncbi:acyl-CoA synthetase [Phycisphaerales bacterium AB-hyl4]|uniref:Acyl-CoA synthetase n=1 Tax=Natronomicrosphaera hydrolytica TaxID=3242702 RepID=A0ABV4UBM9_9BACT
MPEVYNIGVDIVDRHASDPNKLALIFEDEDGRVTRYTFAQVKEASDKLAMGLRGLGVERGDRVGILLPQSPETAIAHAAIYKLGAIALPLFTLFGPDALEYRLSDSGARAIITDPTQLPKLMDVRKALPDLRAIIVTGNHAPAGVHAFDDLLAAAHGRFTPVRTVADDPALIIYTSGTTGNPKGALHAHRVLLGHLPGVELPHEFFPQPDDLFWTPADWAWIGGLIDGLLPAWHHGVPVLAHRPRKFDPEQAFALMARHQVRNTFLPPTALKLMRQVSEPRARFDYKLRSIGSGGETLGGEILAWGRETFGFDINEFYGQTECNLVLANCAGLMNVRPGSMGRAVPGHTVSIINDEGDVLPDGEHGHIAVRRPDPVMFLNYWNNPQATTEKFIGDWLLTGDLGRRDADGYFWYLGRTDDVITSGGYRIGPAEVEDCLLKHKAVAMAAVVGSPDAARTEVVKAFVVLAGDVQPSDALAAEIQHHVKTQLAAHEYPREIEFVSELPMTTTGKIIRRVLRQREIERKGVPQS